MTPEKKGLYSRSLQNKPLIAQRFAQILKEFGIEGKPIPAEELQAIALAAGIRPEENLLSRGIIEMREE